MSEIQYSPDKPKDCKYCYWYEKRKGCTFGEHCYYEVKPAVDFCKKWKKYGTVLVDAEQYEAYCRFADLPLDPPKGEE